MFLSGNLTVSRSNALCPDSTALGLSSLAILDRGLTAMISSATARFRTAAKFRKYPTRVFWAIGLPSFLRVVRFRYSMKPEQNACQLERNPCCHPRNPLSAQLLCVVDGLAVAVLPLCMYQG
ncbi:hypothetical protein Barb4_02443 [Bacteroidales bacterium Barb4]|nr:hypothetical protein Barb4_02443 [Bacteroidales bacterium Barb4]